MTDEGNDRDRPCLVFGDDGSPSADVAWLWVNNHRWPSWHVRVVTGDKDPVPASGWGAPPAVEEWSPPWGRTFFDAESIAGVRFVHMTADPRVALDEQGDATVVVVGRRDLGAVRAFWEGSTSDWLTQLPEVATVVVRSARVARRVRCCVDGSPHSLAAVRALTTLPLAADAQVTVRVADDGHVDVDGAFAAASGVLEAAGIRAAPDVRRGKAKTAVLADGEEGSPDLWVLGTRGWTGWDRLRLGSTAAAVVRRRGANCLVACDLAAAAGDGS